MTATTRKKSNRRNFDGKGKSVGTSLNWRQGYYKRIFDNCKLPKRPVSPTLSFLPLVDKSIVKIRIFYFRDIDKKFIPCYNKGAVAGVAQW